ncbi:MAG TPA: hypothetical protein VGP33_05870 [Chloroflexota bacterium]|jgi:hypothetical protein|nr:hypothetical protein [Chloroflexota bacterium]
MDMAASATGSVQQPGSDQRRQPVVVPPAYPDPETWRRFGLLRRQLQRIDRTPTAASGATKQL